MSKVVALTALLALAFGRGVSPVHAEEVPNAAVVVAAEGVSIPPLSARGVAEIFTARHQFWGTRAKPVLVTLVLRPQDAALHRSFCEQVLSLGPEEYERLLLEKRYQGVLRLRVLHAASEAAALRIVAETPGAITYVRGGGPRPGLNRVYTAVLKGLD